MSALEKEEQIPIDMFYARGIPIPCCCLLLCQGCVWCSAASLSFSGTASRVFSAEHVGDELGLPPLNWITFHVVKLEKVSWSNFEVHERCSTSCYWFGSLEALQWLIWGGTEYSTASTEKQPPPGSVILFNYPLVKAMSSSSSLESFAREINFCTVPVAPLGNTWSGDNEILY